MNEECFPNCAEQSKSEMNIMFIILSSQQRQAEEQIDGMSKPSVRRLRGTETPLRQTDRLTIIDTRKEEDDDGEEEVYYQALLGSCCPPKVTYAAV